MDLLLNFDGQQWDLQIAGGDLVPDNGLGTAVIISILTDVRELDLEELPLGETDPRGWWADSTLDEPGDRTGSKLWNLKGKNWVVDKIKAEELASQALAWIVKDGIAEKVTVEAVTTGNQGLDLALLIKIIRQEKVENFKFWINWETQLGGFDAME